MESLNSRVCVSGRNTIENVIVNKYIDIKEYIVLFNTKKRYPNYFLTHTQSLTHIQNALVL